MIEDKAPLPERSRRRRSGIALRIAAAAVLGAASFYALDRLGLLDLRALRTALSRSGGPVALIAACLAAAALATAVRFAGVARRLRVEAPLHRFVAANLVSQAIAQWRPGSLAAAEVLRFGMLSGLAARSSAAGTDPGAGRRARVGLAILVDRAWGLGAMFAVGGAAGIAFLVRPGKAPAAAPAILLVSLGSLALGGLITAAPLLSETRLRAIASRLLRGRGPASATSLAPRGPRRWLRGAAAKLGQAIEALASGGRGTRRVAAPLLLSLGCAIANPLTLFFAARAVGYRLPLDAILAAVPLTVLAVFLPTGLAGYGGPQLLAAGVFKLFGADPAAVVAACLLQNTVVLAIQTVFGAAGAVLSMDGLRSVRRRL